MTSRQEIDVRNPSQDPQLCHWQACMFQDQILSSVEFTQMVKPPTHSRKKEKHLQTTNFWVPKKLLGGYCLARTHEKKQESSIQSEWFNDAFLGTNISPTGTFESMIFPNFPWTVGFSGNSPFHSPYSTNSSRSRKREPPSDISATLLFIKTQGLFMSHFFWNLRGVYPLPNATFTGFLRPEIYLFRWGKRGIGGVQRPLDSVWNSDPAGLFWGTCQGISSTHDTWEVPRCTGAIGLEILRESQQRKATGRKKCQKIPQQQWHDWLFRGPPRLQLQKRCPSFNFATI